jgi:hypothetical protein
VEKGRNLGVDILNRLLLTLVGLENFQKLLVDLRLVLEAILLSKAH